MISKGPFEDPCIYQYLPGLPNFFIGTHNGLHLAHSMNCPLVTLRTPPKSAYNQIPKKSYIKMQKTLTSAQKNPISPIRKS
jgi:hypothetical protein